MFSKYLIYDAVILIVSGCLAALGWKIGGILKKANSKKTN